MREGSSFTGHGNLGGGCSANGTAGFVGGKGRGGPEACLNRELEGLPGGLLNCPSPPGGPWESPPVAQEGEGLWTWSRQLIWHILLLLLQVNVL